MSAVGQAMIYEVQGSGGGEGVCPETCRWHTCVDRKNPAWGPGRWSPWRGQEPASLRVLVHKMKLTAPGPEMRVAAGRGNLGRLGLDLCGWTEPRQVRQRMMEPDCFRDWTPEPQVGGAGPGVPVAPTALLLGALGAPEPSSTPGNVPCPRGRMGTKAGPGEHLRHLSRLLYGRGSRAAPPWPTQLRQVCHANSSCERGAGLAWDEVWASSSTPSQGRR